MTPNEQSISAARKAAEQWATRDTPFIFDEWYVLGFSHEFERTLVKRTVLGRDLVFFRTEGGTPAAFDDRCVHRSYPLSRGTLDGDTLVCGYHGFRYNAEGNVVEVPSQKSCPKGLGVHAYPLCEKGPLVWVWMGDPAEADEGKIPDQSWLTSSDWVTNQGYMRMEANYVSLHENLLDLTHLSYVHAKSFGTPDYASAPYQTTVEEGYFMLERHVIPTRLPPVWAKSTGLEDCANAARVAKSEFLSPALHETTATFYDNDLPAESRPEFSARTAHIITPESKTSTHYFVVDGRCFATDEDWITDFMHEQLLVAFKEDIDALEALEVTLENWNRPLYEFSVASDHASISMRKYLKKRADASEVKLHRRLHEGCSVPPASLNQHKEAGAAAK